MSVTDTMVEKGIRAGALATQSPFPVSFDGSTLRFQTALFSMLTLAMCGAVIAGWMTREMWRGRRDAYPWEPLFAVRLILGLCGFQAFIRCMPEAAYMITYREGTVEVLAQILMIKRYLDSSTIVPGLTWMVTAYLSYVSICTHLIHMAHLTPKALRAKRPKIWSRPEVKRMACAIVLVFVISTLIAAGKQ